MFNPRFLAAALFLAVALLPAPPSASATTEEEKRKAFMQSQRGADSKTTPAAHKADSTPKPTSKSESKPAKKAKKTKAKPKPAHKKHPSQAPAEEPSHRAQPEPTKKPTPEPSVTPAAAPIVKPAPGGSVVVEKSGVEEQEALPTPEPEEKRSWWWPFGNSSVHYKYLTRSVRAAIDDAPVPRHQWRYIVVHNSGTRQGNAKAFDYYHRNVRKMPNGLAYHFVIGNGTSSGNGAVEIGSRWVRQINGGHVHSDYLNSIALGICLVGDFNRDKPTREQLEALDELIRYLRHRVGKTDHKFAVVKPHRDINPPQWPTDCPGDRFPYEWLSSRFD